MRVASNSQFNYNMNHDLMELVSAINGMVGALVGELSIPLQPSARGCGGKIPPFRTELIQVGSRGYCQWSCTMPRTSRNVLHLHVCRTSSIRIIGIN